MKIYVLTKHPHSNVYSCCVHYHTKLETSDVVEQAHGHGRTNGDNQRKIVGDKKEVTARERGRTANGSRAKWAQPRTLYSPSCGIV